MGPPMHCYYCDNEAKAVCRFCGAGVCGDHTKAGRFVSGWLTRGELSGTHADYVIVNNAIWCGRCSVQPIFAP